MARWIVVDGEQVVIIESTAAGVISVDIPSGPPFVTDRDGARDMRRKLGLAIGIAGQGELR